MFCVRCQKDIAECTCPDIDKRLKELSESEYIVFPKCSRCGKHWERCNCPKDEKVH